MRAPIYLVLDHYSSLLGHVCATARHSQNMLLSPWPKSCNSPQFFFNIQHLV
jgi:hypothetical protein